MCDIQDQVDLRNLARHTAELVEMAISQMYRFDGEPTIASYVGLYKIVLKLSFHPNNQTRSRT